MPTSITDLAAYKTMLNNPTQRKWISKNSQNGVALRPASMWLVAPFPGATPVAPTTAVALSSADAGSMGQGDASGSNNLRLVSVQIQSTPSGFWMLCDRLSQQAGLSGTVTTAQTTNLPTAALTRYTSGVGVMGCLEMYTGLGATPTTFTCTYTAAGGGSHTSVAAVIGGNSYIEVSRILPITLQTGDTGMTAVADVTLGISTGTAGNFGVTLFKPLIGFPVAQYQTFEYDALLGMAGNIPIIQPGACLYWIYTGVTAASSIVHITANFAEDQ